MGRLCRNGRRLTAIARAHRQPSAVPDLPRLTGWLAERQGMHRDALAAYSIDEGARVAAHSPLAVARLSATRGELQIRLGDRESGVTSLRSAHAAFAALGAMPFLKRSQALIEATGASTPPLALRPALDLSPRQEAVALLIAEGMTNKEIAAELYVSVKAVEYHLGQIYNRLGLRSRRELRVAMKADSPAPAYQSETSARS